VNEVVGELPDGVGVVLLGVEVWPDRVVLSMAMAAAGRADGLLAAYQSQFEEWSARPEGRMPRQPARALVEDVRIELDDDAGTVFAFSGGHAGGTGTEWAATRMFTPTVTGERLGLSFTSHRGVHKVHVRLHD
jgi:hypothetical protein